MLAKIVKRGAAELGIALTDKAARDFEVYFEALEERNAVMNLTAISGGEAVARLHFLDSLGVLRAAGVREDGAGALRGAKIIDVGSGAGFPGLPLKIAEPSIALTLLDSSQKKIAFLSELCGKIGTDCECIAARAEELARSPQYREAFDFAVSRAVARLNTLVEFTLPFVKPGGALLAMKSVDTAAELAEAEYAVRLLGGRMDEPVDYEIPGAGVTHRVVIVRKVEATPAEYPRRFAKIQKSPLM